jgi:MFS family permease
VLGRTCARSHTCSPAHANTPTAGEVSHGRPNRTLSFSLALAFARSYAQIGWWSVVLLTFTRLLQGMSVGGQLMTSAVFQIESEPDRSRWGEVGAWVMATANLGSLLGGVVSSILRNTLTEEQLSSWGWRVPFLSGILVGGSGIYLRKFEEEAEEEDGGGGEEAAKREGVKADAPSPARVAFTKYRSEMLSIALVTGGWASAFYVGFIWMPICKRQGGREDASELSAKNMLLLLSIEQSGRARRRCCRCSPPRCRC